MKYPVGTTFTWSNNGEKGKVIQSESGKHYVEVIEGLNKGLKGITSINGWIDIQLPLNRNKANK